jgi:hypothetical protein
VFLLWPGSSGFSYGVRSNGDIWPGGLLRLLRLKMQTIVILAIARTAKAPTALPAITPVLFGRRFVSSVLGFRALEDGRVEEGVVVKLAILLDGIGVD